MSYHLSATDAAILVLEGKWPPFPSHPIERWGIMLELVKRLKPGDEKAFKPAADYVSMFYTTSEQILFYIMLGNAHLEWVNSKSYNRWITSHRQIFE